MKGIALLLLAQAIESTTVAAPPNIGQALLGFVTPGGLATVLTLVGGLVGGLTFLTGRRKRIVALASYYAFHIVEDIGAELDGDDGFDKTARFLKEVDTYMLANGWRPLKAGEVTVAKMQASALHGVEVAKMKVAVEALSAVVPVPS